MVHVLNNNERELAKIQLMDEFPNLTEQELNKLDASLEQLIADISAKTQQNVDLVAKRVEERMQFVYSKSI